MKHSAEFIALVEDVAEDGDLTYREIYQLAEWINANRTQWDAWPVSHFLQLLKKVFADKRIERSEAREVASLVQSVRREWSRHTAESVAPAVEEDLGRVVAAFRLNSAILPSVSVRLPIASASENGVRYIVDLTEPTCTCPDFTAQRSRIPTGNPSRCCKHVLQALNQVRPKHGWPSWLDAFIEMGYRPHPRQKWAVIKVGKDLALISSAPEEWANVYLNNGSENQKFGYSILEDRWSYGIEPPYAGQVAASILKLTSDR